MLRRPPRSTQGVSSAASDVYKRQVYFFCMMIGAMNNLKISLAIILGTILGPVIYLFSSEWAILFAGLTAGSISYLFGVRDGSK